MYGAGISKTGEILDLGVNAEIVEKSGSWYSYNGQRIGQGRENAKKYLKDTPEIAAEIEHKIRNASDVLNTDITISKDNTKESDIVTEF
jgi:recombination protein RecA